MTKEKQAEYEHAPCSNCGQYRETHPDTGYIDCLNDCAARGLAPRERDFAYTSLFQRISQVKEMK